MSAVKARGSMRLKPKRTLHVLATEPTGLPDSLPGLRQRKRPQAIEDSGRYKPAKVESLAMYRPDIKKYKASLIFSGEAGTVIGELMTKLEVDSANEVVLRAIALLVSAQGKEILLRDVETGAFETVEA